MEQHSRHETPQTGAACCTPALSSAETVHQDARAERTHSHDHEHEHEHGHSHDDSDGDSHAGHDHGVLPGWPRIAAALVMAVAAEVAHWLQSSYPWLHYAGMALAVVAIGLSGLGVYKAGWKDLLRLKLGIHALMAVAVTGAFLIGQWPEAAMVMALYVAAERIEDRAMDRARQAIRKLLQLAPETADVLQPDGSTTKQAASDVAVGAWIRITPGARVPLDGTVVQGESSVNQAPITGESALADKAPGDTVFAGSVNQQASLTLEVTAPASDSMLSRIVHAVEQAQATRAPTQRFVDRFAQVYTPIVLVLAIALAVLAPWVMDWSWHTALYQALALLVIACPCALVLSTPVTVVSALTGAAQRGILMKGGRALETARLLQAIALDKTGTLTTGTPALVHMAAWPTADAHADMANTQTPLPDDVVQAITALTSASDHPVSRAIYNGLAANWKSHFVPVDIQALPGRGVQAVFNEALWSLTNLRWVHEQGSVTPTLEEWLATQEAQGRTVSLLSDAQGVRALFAVADPLRPDAAEAIASLQKLGIRPVVLSGDNPTTVRHIAAQAGIEDARGGLLPEDKLHVLAELQRLCGPTGMTGDGINDAPALAQSDLGFAMGGQHSTGMAMETADVVLMHDDLRRIPETVRLSKKAHAVLWQNITLALGIKVAFFVLALAGQASMWMAVVADMGVSLLVVANGLRLRGWKG